MKHGLIYGDIRMIHDPLASRRRSAIFGVIAVVLIAAGSALFAWLRPNPDPGAAAVLRGEDGSLYVRVGEAVHPVTNLTSARLIAGSNEEPERIGDERLAGLNRGVPLGIATAPALFAPEDTDPMSWSVCTQDEKVVVAAGPSPRLLDDAHAFLTTHNHHEWVLTNNGRAQLPPVDDPDGRIIRRALGIDAKTPRIEIDAGVLGAFKEQPPLRLPRPLPELLETQTQAWILGPHGGIQTVTETQKAALLSAGAKTKRVSEEAVSSYPDADPPIAFDIPEQAPQWLDHEDGLCATETGVAATGQNLESGAIELSGTTPATHFSGLHHGAVGVDTGAGHHVVSASGQRHGVEHVEILDVVGADSRTDAPWEIISLLPEGSELSRDAAMTATY